MSKIKLIYILLLYNYSYLKSIKVQGLIRNTQSKFSNSSPSRTKSATNEYCSIFLTYFSTRHLDRLRYFSMVRLAVAVPRLFENFNAKPLPRSPRLSQIERDERDRKRSSKEIETECSSRRKDPSNNIGFQRGQERGEALNAFRLQPFSTRAACSRSIIAEQRCSFSQRLIRLVGAELAPIWFRLSRTLDNLIPAVSFTRVAHRVGRRKGSESFLGNRTITTVIAASCQVQFEPNTSSNSSYRWDRVHHLSIVRYKYAFTD